MKGKSIIAGILILALLVVCGLSIFSVWQGVQLAQSSGVHFNVGSINTVEAKETEEQSLSVSGPVELKVENDFGFITVQPGAGGRVLVKADKTAWGSNDANAQQELKNLKVVIEQDGNKIHVYLQRPAEVDILSIGPSGSQVNFTITVPVETSVDLKSQNGELTLSGTQGTASLDASFGNVAVKELSGALTITASNGKITAENLNADDAAISLSSDFGDITLDTISGGDITVKSTNGAMTLHNVDASGKLEVRSDFGNLEIQAGSARMFVAHTSNGKVRAEGLSVSGTVTISSEFGDLTLIDVLSDGMELKAQNGYVTVSGARGRIKAQSDFGEIDVAAEDAIVTLTSNNGKVSFNGTLVDGEHSLHSDFGDITLTLPADIALNLDLKTDFGKIKSDLPITISGDFDEKHWIGAVNGGGAKLVISTQNGNITIQTTE